jgi:hypothetical protein
MITPSEALPILILAAGFQFKHFVCDGPLQTKEMVISKGFYGQGLGLLHSALHGLGTLVVLLIFGSSAIVSLALAVLDFVIHYHIDYAKENIVKKAGWTSTDAKFWWALSADQMAHHLTYLGLIAISIMA